MPGISHSHLAFHQPISPYKYGKPPTIGKAGQIGLGFVRMVKKCRHVSCISKLQCRAQECGAQELLLKFSPLTVCFGSHMQSLHAACIIF